MAITESRPAQHGGGEPPATGSPALRRRSPWRRPVLLGLGALLATAVVVLAVPAGTYFQPDLLLQEPSNPSGPGAASATDIVCPAGHGK